MIQAILRSLTSVLFGKHYKQHIISRDVWICTARAVNVTVAAGGDYQISCAISDYPVGLICCKINTNTGSMQCKYSNTGNWYDFAPYNPW